MKLCLIRHGQTNWNLENRMQGIEDIPLNNTGRQQAAECARVLGHESWEAIYTSPLQRATETARIISDQTNHTPVILEPLLIERDFGAIAGCSYEKIHSLFPEYPRKTPPGIESYESLCNRMIQAVYICARKSKENILLISHGASMNALLYVLSDGTIGTGITRLKNVCICHLEYNCDTDKISIISHNLSPLEYLDTLH